jgi:hypothetical protein
MPRRVGPSKYAPLTAYLVAYAGDAVRLTLAEIEAIIAAPLPVSAWSSTFWSNQGDTPQARAWLRAGWRTARYSHRQWVDAVTFVRMASATTPEPLAPPCPSLAKSARQRRRSEGVGAWPAAAATRGGRFAC